MVIEGLPPGFAAGVARITIPVWSSIGEAQMLFTFTSETSKIRVRDCTRVGTRKVNPERQQASAPPAWIFS